MLLRPEPEGPEPGLKTSLKKLGQEKLILCAQFARALAFYLGLGLLLHDRRGIAFQASPLWFQRHTKANRIQGNLMAAHAALRSP